MAEPATYSAMHLYGAEHPGPARRGVPRGPLVPAAETLARLRAVKTPRGDRRASGPRCRVCRRRVPAGGVARPRGRAARAGGGGAVPRGPLRGRAARRTTAGRRLRLVHVRPQRRRAPRPPTPAPPAAGPAGRGDLVLVHCNSYAGGFWTDITRTYCLGGPDGGAERMYEAVFAARAAALDGDPPGREGRDVDAAARRVFVERGLDDAFTHSTGHGVGFGAISAHALPRLHPKSDDILRPGMVFNVEPALYFEGFGGVRHCDMVALTATGCEVLTPFQGAPADLMLP